jgi:porin
MRRTLCQHGVQISASYASEVFGIASGGLKRGAVYDGLIYLALDADFEKLAGWSGTTFHASGYYPHGDSGSIKYAGDLGIFSNIDFYDSYRLFELWLDQSFLHGKLSLRAGQLAFDSEFDISDYSALLINSSFGTANAISGNLPVPSYAIAGLGARVKVQPVDWFYAQAAIYDGNSAPAVLGDPSPNAAATNEFNHYGTHWALRRDEGALIAAEIGVQFNRPKPDPLWCESPAEADGQSLSNGKATKAVTAPRGLASAYKFGFACHTDRFIDIRDSQLARLGSSLAPAQARGARGDYTIYLIADQEIWREAGSDTDGVGVFARAAVAPAGRNFFAWSGEIGAVYSGLLRDDGRDQFGLGFAWMDISSRVAAATHDANVADGTAFAKPDYEAIVELTYKFQITKWWNVQPDLQWIIHPGGSHEHDDALILGLRTQITF